MLSIPLYAFLIIYAILFLVFAFFFLTNIGHIISTGSFTFASFAVTLLVIVLAAVTIWLTWTILQNIDWQQPFTIFDKNWFGGIVSDNNIY